MAHELTIDPIGQTIEVEDGQSILDACLRAGVYLPHACGHGRCGTCKVDVLGGEVDHGHASSFALMDFEREEGKCLACTATLRDDVTIEAEIEEDEDAEYYPVEDYVGRVTRIEALTPTIRGIWLELPGDGLTFQAGQYINVHVPGVEGPRAFSLANKPQDKNLLELHVRKVDGGAATTWLHESLEVGTELKLSGPMGMFFVRKSKEKPMIFIAGGSGLSSPKSMILDLIEDECEEPITLVHGARSESELYCRELFSELAQEHEDFTYIPVLSDDDVGPAWAGERGFAHEAMVRHFDGRFAGNTAYLCGPPPMVEASIRALMKGRLFERDIFTEKFVTNADGDAALAKSPLFKRI